MTWESLFSPSENNKLFEGNCFYSGDKLQDLFPNLYSPPFYFPKVLFTQQKQFDKGGKDHNQHYKWINQITHNIIHTRDHPNLHQEIACQSLTHFKSKKYQNNFKFEDMKVVKLLKKDWFYLKLSLKFWSWHKLVIFINMFY